MTPADFRIAVMAAKATTPEYQLRYLAFVTHLGGEAFKGNRIDRLTNFKLWLSDRKRDYVEARPEMVIAQEVGGAIITDHDDFTDFIVRGEWLDSTNC